MRDPKQLEEQRRRTLAAVERRLTEQRERGMPRLRRAREERELAEEMAFDFKLIGLSKQQRYDLLGPAQKWREHIDGRHHHWGENVYIEGWHRLHLDPLARKKDVEERDYNALMMKGDRFISASFAHGDFGLEDYFQLRNLIRKNPCEFGAQLRTGELTLRFDAFHDGLMDLMDEHDPFIARFELSSLGERRIILKAVENPLAEVARLLKEHYASMRFCFDPDELLLNVARTHKALENLHPYVDYNSRTNRLVLNRLLVDANLTPTVLYNPLSGPHMTLAHWAEHIREGQQVWRQLVRDFGNMDRPDEAWTEYNLQQRLLSLFNK